MNMDQWWAHRLLEVLDIGRAMARAGVPSLPLGAQSWRQMATAIVAAVLLAGPAFAHGDPPAKSIDLQNKAFEALTRRDYDEAEKFLRLQAEADPDNFVPYYNLACVLSLKGDAKAAGEHLIKAVERGFTDLRRLRSDPDLTNTREDENYLKIVGNWPWVLEKHRDANMNSARKLFSGKEYSTHYDESLRLAYLSGTDPVSTDQSRDDLARLAAWGVANVFTDLAEDPAAQSRQSLNDAWVIVILPTPPDFQRWSRLMFGADAVEGTSTIGGLYSHDAKRLVAMDLGATLRHEFFHVLHWRSCTRFGQDHPPWIQEGLCSLVEDYVVRGTNPDGSPRLEPVPSWRTNISKRLARGNRLVPIKQLAAMPRDKFIASRPLATYGQARTVFLYLWQKGKLKEWYAHYTAHYAEDPTGVQAIEAVMGMPILDVEKDYRTWVRQLPEVAEQTKVGQASIGAEVEAGAGDGPVIVEIDRRGPAREAGLRLRDVITAIDGQPTRDLNELVRVLGERQPGDTVEISYRRRQEHGTVRITLVPR